MADRRWGENPTAEVVETNWAALWRCENQVVVTLVLEQWEHTFDHKPRNYDGAGLVRLWRTEHKTAADVGYRLLNTNASPAGINFPHLQCCCLTKPQARPTEERNEGPIVTSEIR